MRKIVKFQSKDSKAEACAENKVLTPAESH